MGYNIAEIIEITFDFFGNKRFCNPDVMYPLSFSEFMSVYSGTKQDGWNEYLLYGGLSLIMNITSSEEKINFLKSLFEETYISNIIGRHNLRNRAELEELLNILFSAIGSLTNPAKLSAAFKSVKQLDIGFVCNKGSKRYYIQSAYAIPDQEKMEQEQRSLLLTGNFFKQIIITKDAPAPYYNEKREKFVKSMISWLKRSLTTSILPHF